MQRSDWRLRRKTFQSVAQDTYPFPFRRSMTPVMKIQSFRLFRLKMISFFRNILSILHFSLILLQFPKEQGVAQFLEGYELNTRKRF
jgi:hypothetical protein